MSILNTTGHVIIAAFGHAMILWQPNLQRTYGSNLPAEECPWSNGWLTIRTPRAEYENVVVEAQEATVSLSREQLRVFALTLLELADSGRKGA